MMTKLLDNRCLAIFCVCCKGCIVNRVVSGEIYTAGSDGIEKHLWIFDSKSLVEIRAAFKIMKKRDPTDIWSISNGTVLFEILTYKTQKLQQSVKVVNSVAFNRISHLVNTAAALLNQDPHNLWVVVHCSQMYWKSTINVRQQWVSPCV